MIGGTEDDDMEWEVCSTNWPPDCVRNAILCAVDEGGCMWLEAEVMAGRGDELEVRGGSNVRQSEVVFEIEPFILAKRSLKTCSLCCHVMSDISTFTPSFPRCSLQLIII